MILCGDLPPARCRLGDSGEQRRQRNRTVSSALIIRVPTERPLHQGFQATSKSLWKRSAGALEGVGGHWSLLGLQQSLVKEKPVKYGWSERGGSLIVKTELRHRGHQEPVGLHLERTHGAQRQRYPLWVWVRKKKR